VEAIICEGSFLQVDFAKLCRAHGVPVTIMRMPILGSRPRPARGEAGHRRAGPAMPVSWGMLR
jgi:hypothetical protein